MLTEIRNGLFIGSIHAARTAPDDYVSVTLIEHEVPNTEYKCPLIDGVGNSQEEFEEAVQLVKQARDEHDDVIVHCHAGLSRSVIITATVIAEKEDMKFNDAIQEIKDERRLIMPHGALVDMALAYLNQELYEPSFHRR